MNRNRILRLLAPAALLFAAPVVNRPPVPEPIGILIHAGPDARIAPGPKLEYRSSAPEGELVYAGYKMVTGGERVVYLDFAGREIHTYSPAFVQFPVVRANTTIDQINDDFEIRFESPAPRLKRVRETATEAYTDPVIPPDSYRTISAADRARLARLIASAQQPGAPLSLMTLAWLEERDHQPSDALRDYQALSKTWSSAGWIAKRLPNVQRDQLAGVDRQRRAATSPAEQRWALVIGVRDHKFAPPQPSADKDAELFQAFVRDPKGGGVPPANVFPLINDAATTATMRNRIEQVITRLAGPNDTVYIFISTSGYTVDDPQQPRSYLLGFDSVRSDKQAAAYALADLGQLIRSGASRVKRILTFVDISGSESSAGDAIAVFKEQLTPSAGEAWSIVSSGGTPQAATQSASARPFSSALVAGWRGAAADANGRITVQGLFEYARKQIGGRTELNLIGGVGVPSIELTRGGPAPAAPVQLAMGGMIRLRLPLMQAAPPALDSLALAREEQGQEVIRTYLRGNETQQDPRDFEKAAQFFREAEGLNPSSYLEARRLFSEGRWLIARKDYGRARGILEQAVALDPAGAYSYNALGIGYLEQADYQKAAWTFRDAIRRAPEWIYPRHNLALTYSESGLYRAAEREYRAALKLAPGYGSLHYNLGALLYKLNRRQEAKFEYQTALELNPTQSEALVGMGLLHADQGGAKDLKRAEDLYLDALKTSPAPHIVRQNLGELYLKQDRFKDAIAVLEAAVRDKSDFVPARLALAQAYNRSGDFRKAAEQYAGSSKLRAESPALEMATLENNGDLEKSAEAYREALKLADTGSDRARIKGKLRRLLAKSGS